MAASARDPPLCEMAALAMSRGADPQNRQLFSGDQGVHRAAPAVAAARPTMTPTRIPRGPSLCEYDTCAHLGCACVQGDCQVAGGRVCAESSVFQGDRGANLCRNNRDIRSADLEMETAWY